MTGRQQIGITIHGSGGLTSLRSLAASTTPAFLPGNDPESECISKMRLTDRFGKIILPK
jgi:hypothetical protein